MTRQEQYQQWETEHGTLIGSLMAAVAWKTKGGIDVGERPPQRELQALFDHLGKHPGLKEFLNGKN
jgi:hypothetical protein